MIKFKKLLKKRIDFSPQEMRYKSSTFWGVTLTWTIIGSFGLSFIFACFARIDEVVTTRGELQPYGSLRPIKMPFSAKVDEILINEGEEVIKNQVLIKLDTDIFESRRNKLNVESKSLRDIISNEKELLKRIESVIDEGAVSYFEYIKQKNKIEELISRENQINEELKEINYQLDNSLLKSPLNGKIFNLITFSPGYAGSAGETLLEVVPNGPLEAKVTFNNPDVGFIKTNMDAEIRVDAYPFTQFGSVKGNLRFISEESLDPDQLNNQIRFPGYVSLSNQYLIKDEKKYLLKSGQTVSVNFIVREKPLITLLTDVIANSWDSLRGIKTEGSR
ncbi:HlyD family efflux transporter periplasmic adaptor subunit [Prochlorococcus marinus]|uniref:HlyD family efflux transporter periplasmic adaptor subunit n=1 Tax=Prochlorococcus marinus TaxID=1219 RepID=UPI001ADCB26A|nr:HlyD family efflux transporter periplasmic adaptor subunit [Prochlorococcus marinus]MBO8216991.1 HlyD family efflux transporter periplasmic adaptor subunit [Prochlorococcus marinus XMU1405]MBW3040224.1 hypothetical protein [Prochlorococcus marinus str. MU1405]MBW3047682.1 hypothetical protein [Prochlorococcus marinus str. MU1406]